jgi:serine protease Do
MEGAMMCAGRGKYQGIGLVWFLAAFAAVSTTAAQSRQPGRVLRLESTPGTSGAFLGIQMEDVTASNMGNYKLGAERGVIVRAVEKGSPAEGAKLQENDVILEYCGIPVISAMQFSHLVNETPPDRTVDLVVSRDGKKMNFSVKLGKREDNLQSENLRDWSRRFDFQGPGGRTFQFRVPQPPQGGMRVIPQPGTQEKPRLGVTLQPLTDQMADFLGVSGKAGALVASVESGSAAASKLKAGDVIISVDGHRVGNPDDVSRVVEQKSGGKLDLKVIRDHKEISITVDIPASSGSIRL